MLAGMVRNRTSKTDRLKCNLDSAVAVVSETDASELSGQALLEFILVLRKALVKYLRNLVVDARRDAGSIKGSSDVRMSTMYAKPDAMGFGFLKFENVDSWLGYSGLLLRS